ncbi:MAG: hypothetical protein ACK52N_05005 [Lysobacteraceae bacterium]
MSRLGVVALLGDAAFTDRLSPSRNPITAWRMFADGTLAALRERDVPCPTDPATLGCATPFSMPSASETRPSMPSSARPEGTSDSMSSP